MYASYKGDTEVVRMLLSAGAQVHQPDDVSGGYMGGMGRVKGCFGGAKKYSHTQRIGDFLLCNRSICYM